MWIYVVVGIVMFLIGGSLGTYFEQERVDEKRRLDNRMYIKALDEVERYHRNYIKPTKLEIENRITEHELRLRKVEDYLNTPE